MQVWFGDSALGLESMSLGVAETQCDQAEYLPSALFLVRSVSELPVTPER